MADPKKPKPKPNIYGIDTSNTTTDIRQLFKGLIDFSGKPTGGYNLPAPSTSRTFAFGGAPAPVPFQQSTFMKNIQANMTPAKPTVTPGQPGAGAQGQIGAEKQALAATTAQQRMGSIPNPPGGIPTTRPAAPQGFTADQLYIDPTPAFQPVLDQYAAQQAQLQDRYGENAADIKNIFGNLTTVRALDKTKIAQQYQTSIQQQQDALAARTAETRMNTQAGQQGAATAAGEMGTAGQPAPTDSLTAQAAEQGVADSNAYQTTWAALQNVMSQQAQNDVQSAVQGYDYQKTAGLEQLRNNLEDRLAAIQGDVAGTQSQLAQAKLSGQQTVANAKYGEAQDAKAQAAALAAAQAKASTPKEQSFSKDIYGWGERVASAGKDATGITNSINQAATAELNAQRARGIANPKLTKANLQNRWLVMFQGDPSTEFAIDYIKNYSGYGS